MYLYFMYKYAVASYYSVNREGGVLIMPCINHRV